MYKGSDLTTFISDILDRMRTNEIEWKYTTDEVGFILQRLMPQCIGLSLQCCNALVAAGRLHSATPLRMVPFGLLREKAQHKRV